MYCFPPMQKYVPASSASALGMSKSSFLLSSFLAIIITRVKDAETMLELKTMVLGLSAVTAWNRQVRPSFESLSSLHSM